MLRIIGIAALFAASAVGPVDAAHFSNSPSVICGSEETIKRWSFEYENGRPYTVFSTSPGYKGGPACDLNMIALLKPDVTLVRRDAAFCEIKIHLPDNGIDRRTFWVHCLSLTAE